MSLFSALNLGTKSLSAAQMAINVTGQNISNANTEGYSRKRTEMSASSHLHEAYGQIGTGVEVDAVTRVRDSFLDAQISEQASSKGYYGQVDKALSRLESVFNEPSEAGLNEYMGKFWDGWQDLANNPSDLSARTALASSAQVLTDTLHSMTAEINAYSVSQDQILAKKVEEVNRLSAEIYSYNEDITVVELRQGENANDSRDKRDLAIRNLSELMDIQTIEDSGGRISVTSGGHMIVGPAYASRLELGPQKRKLEDGSQVSVIGLRFANSGKPFQPRSGELKGILDARDEIIPAYQKQLDDLAKTLVTEVNTLHTGGYNLNRHTGINFFNPAGTTAGTLELSSAIKADAKNISAAAGGVSVGPIALTTQVIPPALSPTLDLKTVNSQYKDLIHGSVKIELTAGGLALEEGAGKDYVVDYERGTVTFLDYARFSPGEALSIDFRFDQKGFPGNGNGEMALGIAQLRQKATMSENLQGTKTQSMNEFYSSFIGSLGINRNQTKTSLETKEFMIQQLENRQAEIAGVSIDEELASMIKFEHSYQASARFISTIDKMLDALMGI